MTNDFDLRPAATRPGGLDGSLDGGGTTAATAPDPAAEPPIEADAAPVGRPARPRDASLLADDQRAGFLTEWDAVQTGFVADPQRAAEAAERLVAELADSVKRRVGQIADAVAQPGAGTSGTGDEEMWRERLLRCREAFHLLIDS
ncbi:hypothetical protein [Catenulispora subtropica]|uniref:Uncharacterized protein n=1 Tax=Catenulispora subtropica TaxID=450798 RepID=A0ABN2SI98_9ACTN